MQHSLPRSFLDELLTRVSLYEIAGRHVRWHAGKSNPSRRDWWACCPFHQEKTPSFHVDEEKGFYNCFGCGAKGNAISFVMAIERLTFFEAVKNLAERVSLPLPETTPEAIAEEERLEQRSERIRSVLEEAQDFFSGELRKQSAGQAREHLLRRGIAPGMWEHFSLGFAPGGGRLQQHLADKSFSQSDMVDAGLLALGEQDRKPYERFRNRIIFPIHDERNRLIAFGGRALAGNVRAKYINSPESLLFQKRESLYNLTRARRSARESQGIILVEGYIDVIAMTMAGFAHVVAPLGTALGEQQIALLWRLAAEPIVCFDGDAAGIRAAARVVELLLERLRPGYSMRFALLPRDQDPEDILRRDGSDAMKRLLDSACPLDEMLWQREVSRSDWRTPERRAQLELRLQKLVARIRDGKVRAFYQSTMRRRVRGLFFGSGRDASPSLAARRSTLVGTSEQSYRRIRLLLYLCIRFPVLAERYCEELSALEIRSTESAAVRDVLLETISREQVPEFEELQRRLDEGGLGGIAREFQRSDWASPVAAEGVNRADFTLSRGDELWRHVHALEKKAATRRRDIPDAVAELASFRAGNDEDDEREVEPLHRLRALHEELSSPQGNETRFATAESTAGMLPDSGT